MTTASDDFGGIDADTRAAQFVLKLLEEVWGLRVRYSDRMRAPYDLHTDTGTIWLPKGLSWAQEHARIDRCWLFSLGGRDWAPEFPDPGSPPFTSNVLPLRRTW